MAWVLRWVRDNYFRHVYRLGAVREVALIEDAGVAGKCHKNKVLIIDQKSLRRSLRSVKITLHQ